MTIARVAVAPVKPDDYGLSWFKVYLDGDQRYKQFLLDSKPAITSKYMTNLK